jgi:Spx/MgsR family transcriptional regulator
LTVFFCCVKAVIRLFAVRTGNRPIEMTVTIYGIKNCDTMKKAFAWLGARGVAYDFHDYKKAGVTTAQLADWCRAAGWQAVLNRAGTTFRKLDDADKEALTQDKAIALMVDNPSMIKRPVIEADGKVEIGFKPERCAALFSRAE